MSFAEGKIAVSEVTHAALKGVRATGSKAATWLTDLVTRRERTDDSVIYDLSREPFSHLAAEEPKTALLRIASELGSEARTEYRRLALVEATLRAVAEEVTELTTPSGIQGGSILVKPETYQLLTQSCKLYLDYLGMAHEELELVTQNTPSVCVCESIVKPLQDLQEKLKLSYQALMRACQAVHMESLSQSEMAEYGLDHHGSVGNFGGEPFTYSYSEEVLILGPNGYVRRSEIREVPFKLARVNLSNVEVVDFVIRGLREMTGKD